MIPAESNYLLNPTHPEFAAVEILELTLFEFDSRLKGSALPAF